MDPITSTLGESREVEPGVSVTRRCFMTAATLALGSAGALASTRQADLGSPAQWDGEARIDLETFLREVIPAAKALVGDTSRLGQDRYLHTMASHAVRLGEIAEPAKMRDSGQGVGDGTWFGFQPGGDPFVLLHWRMEPGSAIRRHAHSYGHVVTLVMGGELLVENHEMLGERDFEHEGTFKVRRTQRQILRAGNVNLVSLEHDYVHGFYAGDTASHGFDITTKIRERRPTPYLELAEKPLDAAREIYEGSWSFD